MSWAAIYKELLARPAGWIAAGLFYLASVPLFAFLTEMVSEADYFEYIAIFEVAGLVLFALYAFPTLRYLVRGRVELGSARWALWSMVAAALLVLTNALTVPAYLALYMLDAELIFFLEPRWMEALLISLISAFLLGLDVWLVGVILGRKRPGFRECHQFVWGERKAVFAVYLVLSMVDFVISYGVASIVESWGTLEQEILYSARYAFFTWCLSLFVVALYIDLVESQQNVAEVFE